MRFPGPREFLRGTRDVALPLHLDCAWELGRPARRPAPSRRRVRGYGRAGRTLVASLKERRLGRAPVRLTLTLMHPVNPGVPATRESAELRPA